MSLVRYRPFDDVFAWKDRFDRLFDLSLGPWLGEERPAPSTWMPAVDVYEDENQVVIKADLPDLDQKDLSIEVVEGTLRLKGERKFEKEEKRENYRSLERRYGSFVRAFQLPPTADADKINANYDKGVLTIEVPKREESKPKQIKIGTK